MFTAPSTNRQHRPAARIRPGRELIGAWTDLPSSRVYTSTRKPVNFIRRELLISRLHHVNRFGRQHVNSAARCQGNLSSPERVNLFPAGNPQQVGKLTGQRVHRQTRKHVPKQTSKPAIWPTQQREQEVNMSSKFRCEHANTLTTSMVHS